MFSLFNRDDTDKDAALLVRTLNHLVTVLLPLPDADLFEHVRREFGPSLHRIEGRAVYVAYADFPDFKFELDFNAFEDSSKRQVCAVGRGKYASLMVLQTSRGLVVSCEPTMHGAPTRAARSLAQKLVDGYGFTLHR